MAGFVVSGECRGCTRQKNGRCIAIVDPVGLWRNGGCWAYTADPHWEEEVEKRIAEYVQMNSDYKRYEVR